MNEKELEEFLRGEAEYAETHKDVPLQEGTVITRRRQRSNVFSIRLSDDERRALELASARANMPPSSLARQWIAERLATSTEAVDVREIASVLETLAKRLSSL